ncbi:hypothetical protein [Cupriavidus pauculus]|uniref:hypothetical protein n=1 Tax=Cupriavidus pauculus TaxID=82633 RepID=UPI001D0C8BDF|nr:hypothetical protein [Cupriavidus pauculus]
MSENLEELTPNQRRALDKALAALETMAAMWGAEIRIHDVAQKLAAKPEADRAKSIAAFIEQAFIEGAYRHYLDRDPAANPELERALGGLKALKCVSLSIQYNDHVLIYQPIVDWLIENCGPNRLYEVTDDDRAEIVRTGECWTLRWYPDTPVGFNAVAAATLERCIEIATGAGHGEEGAQCAR